MSTGPENEFLCNRKCTTMPGDSLHLGSQPTLLPAEIRLPTERVSQLPAWCCIIHLGIIEMQTAFQQLTWVS